MTDLSDSRFYMWRAIFALAHADGHVSAEERRFMDVYLSRLPATQDQKQTLQADIAHAQDVGAMFSKIMADKDRDDFFNFARLLVWCDGDFSEQEKRIMDMVRQRQDTPLGTERMLLKLQSSGHKKADWLKKIRVSVEGLKDVFEVFSTMGDGDKKSAHRGSGMSDSRFHMWRAVFAMAHADDVVTVEEKKYLKDILNGESFNEEQKSILERDIDTAQDIAEMFLKIEDQNDRSQFFYHARMLVWSDGDFGEQEQKIIMRLKQNHVRTVDFNEILENLDLSLDEDQKAKIVHERKQVMTDDAPESFFSRLIRQIAGR